jgi:hypothetical protein
MFFAAVGLGAGVAVGIWAIRKFERTTRQLTPDALIARAGERAGGLGERLSYAFEAGRQAADAKEAELRDQFLARRSTQPAAGGARDASHLNRRGGDRDARG